MVGERPFERVADACTQAYGHAVGSLSSSRVARLLDVLHLAAEADGPDPFPEPVVDALRLLVLADGGSLNEFRGRDRAVRDHVLSVLDFACVDTGWCFGGQEWTPAMEEACRLHVRRDDPIPPTSAFLDRGARYSDLLTRRQLLSSGLYADVGRYTWGDDALHLWFTVPGDDTLRRIAFNRYDGGRFEEDDAEALTLLVPHLRRLYARAAARRRDGRWAARLTAREREVLALVAQGRTNSEIARILWLSPHTVRTHMEHIFEKLEVTTRAAAVVRVGAASGDSQAAGPT
jgi:DNA-binding CsgD family transcriptional regulator